MKEKAKEMGLRIWECTRQERLVAEGTQNKGRKKAKNHGGRDRKLGATGEDDRTRRGARNHTEDTRKLGGKTMKQTERRGGTGK